MNDFASITSDGHGLFQKRVNGSTRGKITTTASNRGGEACGSQSRRQLPNSRGSLRQERGRVNFSQSERVLVPCSFRRSYFPTPVEEHFDRGPLHECSGRPLKLSKGHASHTALTNIEVRSWTSDAHPLAQEVQEGVRSTAVKCVRVNGRWPFRQTPLP